jgi:hypothetical protein
MRKISNFNLPVKRLTKAAISTIGDIIGLQELFIFSGLGAVGYGVAQIYPPAAWIVVGAVVFLIGMIGFIGKARR